MNALEFPVIITDISSDSVTIQAQQAFMQCPKCARGEGCGAYPWFQGFLFKQSASYTLPLQQVKEPQALTIEHAATLRIDRTTMNILSILTYGLALAGFMLGLSLAVIGLNEAVQLIAAIIGLVAGVMLNKPIAKWLLARHLSLHKPKQSPVQTNTSGELL